MRCHEQQNQLQLQSSRFLNLRNSKANKQLLKDVDIIGLFQQEGDGGRDIYFKISLLALLYKESFYILCIASISHPTEQKINRRVTRVGTSEVYVPTRVVLRMFIMQVLASQLHFLANRNAELVIPPLFWPVNCIKQRDMLHF